MASDMQWRPAVWIGQCDGYQATIRVHRGVAQWAVFGEGWTRGGLSDTVRDAMRAIDMVLAWREGPTQTAGSGSVVNWTIDAD